MKQIVLMTVMLIGVAGCDNLNNSKEQIELARIEQQRHEQELLQKNHRVNSLKTYILGKVKFVDERVTAISDNLVVVLADAEKLEKRESTIMSATDDGGKELSYEVRILRLLKDEEVNQLAVKYLSGGFSVQAEEFVAKVRGVYAAEKKYRDAVRSVEEQYEQAVNASEKWIGASKMQRNSEIRRIEKEISAIEKKRASTRREMVTAGSRVEWANKMSDYEREIAKKRWQIDYLRNPDANRKIESRAAQEWQGVVRDANSEKRNQLHEIDRRLKPTVTVVEIAKEVQRDTLDVLRLKIKGQIEKLQTESRAMNKKLTIGREILHELPVCSLGELERIKIRVDKDLELH